MGLLIFLVFMIQFSSYWVLNSSTLLLTSIFEFRFFPYLITIIALIVFSGNSRN